MAERLLTLIFRKKPLTASTSPSGKAEPANRVLVVGLGPAGRQVVQTLLAHNLEPVIIDVNPKSRDYASQQSLHLHLGDAGQERESDARGLARNVHGGGDDSDPRAAVRIVEMIRQLRPMCQLPPGVAITGMSPISRKPAPTSSSMKRSQWGKHVKPADHRLSDEWLGRRDGLPPWRTNPGIDHRKEIVADVKVCICRKINKKSKRIRPIAKTISQCFKASKPV